jgi:hypothetical protein
MRGLAVPVFVLLLGGLFYVLLALLPGPSLEATAHAIPPPPAPAPGPLVLEPFLESQLDWACSAVETACTGSFQHRPLLRLVDREEMTRVRKGPSAGPPTTRDVELLGRDLGWFYREENTIYVNRVVLQEISLRNGLGAAFARWVLVHEVAHALDHARFPVFLDASRALVEGHAQYVVGLVAAQCGRSSEFEEFLGWMFNGDPFEGEQKAAADRMHWHHAYAAGRLLFVQADEIGGPALIEDLLAAPPGPASDPRSPREWLQRRWTRLQNR